MWFEIIKKLIYYGCFRLLYRIERIDYDKIPKSDGFVLCANHTSNWDVPALVLTIPRKLHFMAKESLFRVFLIGRVVKMSGAFPVKRETNDLGAVKTALSLLKNGEAVAMFPEATRVRGDKKVDAVKAGVAMLAVKAKVPVVPVGISATFKPFSKVSIRVGEPISVEEYSNRKLSGEETSELADRMFDKVKELVIK